MQYEQLVGLLSPEQLAQMEAVRAHLLERPDGLDRVPTESLEKEQNDAS